MSSWIIILLIAVVIFFYNFIKAFIKARRSSVKKSEQQKSKTNKNTANKEIKLPTPKGYGRRSLIEYDPQVYWLANREKAAREKAAREKQEKQKMQEAIRMQIKMQQEAEEARKRQQLRKIPWTLIGAFGPDVVKKFMNESEKKLLEEELRKKKW